MAVVNVCGKLYADFTGACAPGARKQYQQFVLINKADIDTFTIEKPSDNPGTCKFNIKFTLKCGLKGYRISGLESGNVFKAWSSKSRDDNGYPVYQHQAEMFIHGISETVKCLLDGLDRGNYILAAQAMDGTIEIFGWYHGLQTGDYDYDITAGGGGSVIPLSSLDDAPEPYHPFIYTSSGDALADFDSAFAGPSC